MRSLQRCESHANRSCESQGNRVVRRVHEGTSHFRNPLVLKRQTCSCQQSYETKPPAIRSRLRYSGHKTHASIVSSRLIGLGGLSRHLQICYLSSVYWMHRTGKMISKSSTENSILWESTVKVTTNVNDWGNRYGCEYICKMNGQSYIPCHLGLKRLGPSGWQVRDPRATICLSNEIKQTKKQKISKQYNNVSQTLRDPFLSHIYHIV